MNDIPNIEDLVLLNIFLYDIDFVKGNITGELAWRSVQKHESPVGLLRYINHLFYVSNITAVFQSFRWPNCDTYFIRPSSLERHLITCTERVNDVYPNNVGKTQETLHDKLDSLGIEYKIELETTFRKISYIRHSIDLHA